MIESTIVTACLGWTDLPDGGGQQVDDALVRHGHHALRVDLDDAVADAHAAALRDAAAQQAADHAVLHAEPQLVLRVRPLDLHLHHGRARHHRQLHHRLVLGVLYVRLTRR